MAEYKFDNIHKRDENQRVYADSSIKFYDHDIVLYSGFEITDGDGDHVFEKDETYTFSLSNSNRIISIMPEEFKAPAILSAFEGSNDFYLSLRTDVEKTLFLCILNAYNSNNHKFELFAFLLNENKITCDYGESHY
jgi:hypothetical protein